MKKLVFLCMAFLALSFTIPENDQPFKGKFRCSSHSLILAIDLYDTTIVSPTYSFLGKMNGYLTGDLYDAWFITSHQIKNGKATVNFTNDLDSYTQETLLYFDEKGQLIFELQGDNVLRKKVKNKWAKLPNKYVFQRINSR